VNAPFQFTPLATEDLDAIWWFIAQDSREAADRVDARVGKGSLLATSFDLSTNLDTRPVARQLLHSLQEYVRGDRFHPSQPLSLDELDKLLQ
jgi:plasmid stabilization system protein ParE